MTFNPTSNNTVQSNQFNQSVNQTFSKTTQQSQLSKIQQTKVQNTSKVSNTQKNPISQTNQNQKINLANKMSHQLNLGEALREIKNIINNRALNVGPKSTPNTSENDFKLLMCIFLKNMPKSELRDQLYIFRKTAFEFYKKETDELANDPTEQYRNCIAFFTDLIFSNLVGFEQEQVGDFKTDLANELRKNNLQY